MKYLRDVCNRARSIELEAIVILHFMITYTILMTDFVDNLTEWYVVFFSMAFMLPLLALEFLIPIHYVIVCVINSVLFYFVFYVNEFIRISRGRPIHYMDIYSINDALAVKDHYSLVFSAHMAIRLFWTLFFLAISIVLLLLLKEKRKRQYKRRFFSGLVCAILSPLMILVGLKSGLISFDFLIWDENEYVSKNTPMIAWVSEYLNSKVNSPEGYDRDLTDRILGLYGTPETNEDSEAPENIIVIMNESLADYSLVGNTSLMNDPIPFIHSMDKRTAKGKLYVTAYGGNTCNTEFEFLTGNSLYFLPWQANPYVTYSLDGCETLPKCLNDLGYNTTAIHPYFAEEWKRTQNYRSMGFNDFISGEDFSKEYKENKNADLFNDLINGVTRDFGTDLEYYRGFISDRECYNKVIETINNDNGNGKKSFVFAVTVQNHGDYSSKVLDYDKSQRFTDDGKADVEQYLNLCKISDEAFQEFIQKLEDLPQKTVVVLFGDHQPNIDFRYYEDGKPFSYGTNVWQDEADDYTMFYVMWSNYDIDWAPTERISINYLSAYMKTSIGLPMTAYDNLRMACAEEIPVLTWRFCVDSEGNFIPRERAWDCSSMQAYSFAQYRKMFDWLK